MNPTNEEAEIICRLVHQIVHRMCSRPHSIVEEVEADIIQIIICRLNKISKLENNLEHYVRMTASREAKKLFSKHDDRERAENVVALTNAAKLNPALDDPNDHVARQEDLDFLFESLTWLPADEMLAISQYFELRPRLKPFRDYYKRNCGLDKLRRAFRNRGS